MRQQARCNIDASVVLKPREYPFHREVTGMRRGRNEHPAKIAPCRHPAIDADEPSVAVAVRLDVFSAHQRSARIIATN
jgi:hypothetical protein